MAGPFSGLAEADLNGVGVMMFLEMMRSTTQEGGIQRRSLVIEDTSPPSRGTPSENRAFYTNDSRFWKRVILTGPA